VNPVDRVQNEHRGGGIVRRRRCRAGRDKPMDGDTTKATLLRVLQAERECWEANLAV